MYYMVFFYIISLHVLNIVLSPLIIDESQMRSDGIYRILSTPDPKGPDDMVILHSVIQEYTMSPHIQLTLESYFRYHFM